MGSGETATDVRLRLELKGVPSSVTLVRSVLRTLARTSELGVELLDDLGTAVSEACNNVVLHAYPAKPGPLIFSLAIRADAVEVAVRDRGCGICPGRVDSRGLGMGIVLINSLADQAEFTSGCNGTEVRMLFKRPVAVPASLDRLSIGLWTLADVPMSELLPARPR